MNIHSFRRPLATLATAAALASLSQPGLAALGENIGISVRAMSLGNAVTADPGGIEAVHYNPAGLTDIQGKQADLSVIAAKLTAFASFAAPADYAGVLGFKEDPIIGESSQTHNHALYIPGSGLHRPNLPVIVAPLSGFAYNEPSSRFTFATMAFAPQIVTYDRNGNDDPARYDGRTVDIQRFTYLAPSMGYKVSDTLSLGITGALSHQALALETDFRAPNMLIGLVARLQKSLCPQGGNPIDTILFGLCSDGRLSPFNKIANIQVGLTVPSDPTINLGVTWKPTDWFAFGAVYQSGSKMRMTGTYQVTYDKSIQEFIKGVNSSALGPIVLAMLAQPNFIPPQEKGNVSMTLHYPAHVQLGTKITVGNLKVSTDASWTEWSQWNNFTLQFDQQLAMLQMARLFGFPDATKLVMPRGYKDTWSYGLGLEYDLTPRARVRMGAEYRKSSVGMNNIDAIAPLSDAILWGLGGGYDLDKNTSVDFSLAVMNTKAVVPANTSCNLNCTGLMNIIYNPYAGLDVTTGLKIDFAGLTVRKKF